MRLLTAIPVILLVASSVNAQPQVQPQPVVPRISASMGIKYEEMPIKKGTPRGVMVSKFYEKSGFKDAGGKIGDIIIQVGKTEITKSSEYAKVMRESKIDSTVEVTVMRRNGEKAAADAFDTEVLKVKLDIERGNIPVPVILPPPLPDKIPSLPPGVIVPVPPPAGQLQPGFPIPQPFPGGIAPVFVDRPGVGIQCSENMKVLSFRKGSTFEKAGGKIGDVILKVGEDKVSSSVDMEKIAKKFKADTTIKIEVQRGDETETLTVKIIMEKIPLANGGCLFPPPPGLPPKGDVDLPGPGVPLNPGQFSVEFATLGIKFVHNNKDAAKVTDFEADSAFKKAGGQVGDIIIKLDDKKIKHGYDLLGGLATRKPGQEVKVEVNREGKIETLTVTLGKEVKVFGTGVITDPNNPNPPVGPLPPLPPLTPRPVPLPAPKPPLLPPNPGTANPPG